MAILEKESALQYLDRLVATLKPEKHPFSQIPLVSGMVYLQRHYLQRLMDTGQEELAMVKIHASGFPELKSMFVDIKHAVKGYMDMRRTRAAAMMPLIQQLANANPSGIAEVGKDVARVFDADRALANAFSKFNEAGIVQMVELANGHGSKLIYYDQDYPGLLMTNNISSPFQTLSADELNSSYSISSVPNTTGLKYLDAPDFKGRDWTREVEGIPPAFLYVAFVAKSDKSAKAKVSNVMLGTSEIDLISGYLSRSYSASGNFDLGQMQNFRARSNIEDRLRQPDVKAAMLFSEQLKRINKNLVDVFLGLDVGQLTPEQVRTVAQALPQFDLVLQQSESLAEKGLSGSMFEGAQIEHLSSLIADKLSELYQTLPDDSVRNQVQVGMAAVLGHYWQEAEKLLPSPSIPQLESPRSLITTPVVTEVAVDKKRPRNLWARLRGK